MGPSAGAGDGRQAGSGEQHADLGVVAAVFADLGEQGLAVIRPTPEKLVKMRASGCLAKACSRASS